MEWIENYHEDHKAVLIMLAKLEGNILDLKHGMATPNSMLEFQEFGEIIKTVILPHFKNEEKTIYPEASAVDDEMRLYIKDMYEEHNKLYKAFDQYQQAVEAGDNEQIIASGLQITELLRQHILKEEDEIPNMLRKKRTTD